VPTPFVVLPTGWPRSTSREGTRSLRRCARPRTLGSIGGSHLPN